MRRVKVFKWHRDKGEVQYRKVEIGQATFHQFGVGYEEFESGPGNFSTAIIEWDDGRVDNYPVEMIQFITEDTP